jgi:hypothetical protein
MLTKGKKPATRTSLAKPTKTKTSQARRTAKRVAELDRKIDDFCETHIGSRPKTHVTAKRVEDLDREINDFCEAHIGSRPISREKPPAAMTVRPVKAPRGPLTTRECHGLLEDFRRSYHDFEQSFLALGEQAAAIREHEAFGDQCRTFDEWIKQEHYDRSVVYACMKAARICRLTAPVAEPLKIVLDRESHFREFPADASAKQARAIVRRLEQIVAPDADGTRHPTARQIKNAVLEVCEKADRGGRTEPQPGMFADGPRSIGAGLTVCGDPSDFRKAFVDSLDTTDAAPATICLDALGAETEDGSDPSGWNGRLHPFARRLRGLARWLRRTVEVEFSDPACRLDVASLLRSIATEVQVSGIPPRATTAARRSPK